MALYLFLYIMKSYTKYTIKIKVKSKILSIQRLNNKINEKSTQRDPNTARWP